MAQKITPAAKPRSDMNFINKSRAAANELRGTVADENQYKYLAFQEKAILC